MKLVALILVCFAFGCASPDRLVELSLANIFDEPETARPMFAFSILNAALRTNESIYPVVLNSHGYGNSRRSNTEQAEDLASHGYIVASMDHIDCSGTVFPNGRLIEGIHPGFSDDEATRTLPGRIRDVVFVLDELTRLNRDDPLFAGRLDLARLGGMGHSHGLAPWMRPLALMSGSRWEFSLRAFSRAHRS